MNSNVSDSKNPNPHDTASLLADKVKVDFENLSFPEAFEYCKEGRMIRPNDSRYWWRLDMHGMYSFMPEYFTEKTWQASEVFDCIKKY